MEHLCNISIKQNHIGTKLVLSVVLAANSGGKIVFWTHLIVLVGLFRFLIHMIAFHAKSRAWH